MPLWKGCRRPLPVARSQTIIGKKSEAIPERQTRRIGKGEGRETGRFVNKERRSGPWPQLSSFFFFGGPGRVSCVARARAAVVVGGPAGCVSDGGGMHVVVALFWGSISRRWNKAGHATTAMPDRERLEGSLGVFVPAGRGGSSLIHLASGRLECFRDRHPPPE